MIGIKVFLCSSLHKASFLWEIDTRRGLLRICKGDKRVSRNSFNHGASTNSSPSEHLISYHPLDPEEVIQSLTLKLALLRLGSGCLWSSICLQVVHNRGHGFSKRFNPAGVHNFAHTWRLSPGPSRRILAGWWSPTTFTLRRPIPWATPKGSSRHREIGRFPPSHFKTFSMRMSNGNPGLGSSWISLSKLVSRQESHTSTCGCTLVLDQATRTRVLGRLEWVK
jgi:hypothetical protein